MADYVRGDLVWVPFPFSSGESYQGAPCSGAGLLAYFNGTDYLVCMVTTQQEEDPYSMPLLPGDMAEGKLSAICYIRPTYIFAVDGSFIKRRLGRLKSEKTQQIVTVLTDVLNSRRCSLYQWMNSIFLSTSAGTLPDFCLLRSLDKVRHFG